MARVVWVGLGLVLLNLVLVLWPQSDDRSNLAAPEINADQLELLAEVAVPEVSEPLVDEQIVNEPLVNEQVVNEVALSEPAPVPQSDGRLPPGVFRAPAPSDAQSDPEPTCFKIGPFVNINAFTMTRSRLDQLGIPFTLGQVGPRSASVVRLYTGPYNSYAEAEAAQAGLRERGLMDHFIKPDEETWVLSIGVFAERDRAEQRLQLLQRRDPGVKLRVEYGEIPPGSWVIIESAVLGPSDSAALLTIPWHESGVELSVSPCSAPLVVDGENG